MNGSCRILPMHVENAPHLLSLWLPARASLCKFCNMRAAAAGADRSTRLSHSCSMMNGSCRILPMSVENAPHLRSLWLPARASLCKFGKMRQQPQALTVARLSHSCSMMNGSCRILPMHVENAPHLLSLWLPARASLCKFCNMRAAAAGADRSTRLSHSCSMMNGSCRILPMSVENAPHLRSLWLPARASLCKFCKMRQQPQALNVVQDSVTPAA